MKKQTNRQMAVAIAEDVIAQIKFKRYIALAGVYVAEQGEFKPGDLQKQLLERKKPCTICALGSLFLSKARLFNAVEIQEDRLDFYDCKLATVDRERDIIPALDDYFTTKELEDIEAAFEMYDETLLNDLVGSLNDEDRLIYLMKEIILQKGRFDINKASVRAEKIIARSDAIRSSSMETAMSEIQK